MEGAAEGPSLSMTTTNFERFAIFLTVGSVAAGPGGQFSFRLFWFGRPYVLRGHRELRRLRLAIATLVSLAALALTTSTAGYPLSSGLKLLTVPLVFVVPWLIVRTRP
jgi:hypothetical protein